MEKDIKIERIKDCISKYQISTHLYDEDIEKYDDKIQHIYTVGFFITYTIMI